MSIDFGTDIYEEPLVSKSFLPEDSGELSLRPHTLREYIGQPRRICPFSSRRPAAGRSLWTMCCSTAPRAWAKPPWPASSPPRWG